MKTTDIRKEFIEFFKGKQHKFAPPVNVAPKNDPTLLFINAGMNQFKPYFLGEQVPDSKRMANSQKCIRVSGKHNDLEEVGRDTYHHTFFEMLGNWSFGDYYKEDAIKWSWELLTEVWKLPKDKLYATVYRDDDEAMELWKKYTDIDPEHVLKFDEKDNFWEMGETGPCGPCSEIHMDLGEEFDNSPNAFVNSDSPRYIEIWNLVFMQYYRDENKKLHPLKDKHVDTGMGLERISSILQKKYDNYQIDLFEIIRKSLEAISNLSWDENEEIKTAFRVIMDHIRTLVFSINDGVMPSNDGRGYVIRRILRRAFRFGRKLNLFEPFLYKLVDSVIDAMGDYYTELKNNPQRIKDIIKKEEERFNKTLDRGIDKFNSVAENTNDIISGKDLFSLYDTYGFPVDLTTVMAEEKGLGVDLNGYEIEMDAQRTRARSASKFKGAKDYDYIGDWIRFSDDVKTEFVGYENIENESKIVRYIFEEDEGKVYVILDQTPFYAESGGQLADTGLIKGNDFVIDVEDVQKFKDFFVHIGTLDGEIKSEIVSCFVDREQREKTMKNHSATHLLQAALNEIISKDIHQAGSFNNSEKLRFDFTYDKPLTKKELEKVEKLVNSWIMANYNVETKIMDVDEAKKEATALFDEKYGDKVRVVKMGSISSELCGGTHVPDTGFIGAFSIVQESAVASGVRRIEAVTSNLAIEQLLKNKYEIIGVANKLAVKPSNVLNKVNSLLNELDDLKKEIKRVKKDMGFVYKKEKFKVLNNVSCYIENYNFESKDDIKLLTEDFAKKNKESIFVGVVRLKNKISYLVIVGDSLLEKFNAGVIVKKLAEISGGRGGGRKNVAQANVGDEKLINNAMESLGDIIV